MAIECTTMVRVAMLRTQITLNLKVVPVRPEFTGTLGIKSGRHPVLECVQAAGTLVPNDVYCADDSSFQIVQGPK